MILFYLKQYLYCSFITTTKCLADFYNKHCEFYKGIFVILIMKKKSEFGIKFSVATCPNFERTHTKHSEFQNYAIYATKKIYSPFALTISELTVHSQLLRNCFFRAKIKILTCRKVSKVKAACRNVGHPTLSNVNP